MKTLFIILIFYSMIFSQSNIWTKVVDVPDFPEGPAWDYRGSLYFSSCYGGWVGKFSDNKLSTFTKTSDPDLFKNTNGLVFAKDNRVYACEFGNGSIVCFDPTGKCEVLISKFQGRRFNRPNDLAFAPNGKLYFTDPNSHDGNNPDGRLFLLDLDSKNVKLVADKIAFSNGLAFSSDGSRLFVCESALSRILVFDVNDDGTLINRQVFVKFPIGDPDGIAFDVNNNLYAAVFGSGYLYVVSPEGNIIDQIKTPGAKPSNIDFGGKDLKTIFLTEDETNAVYMMETQVSGLKLFYSPDTTE